jgi:excisionase family DNA binding protein
MHDQATTTGTDQPEPGTDAQRVQWRQACRDQALRNALCMREAGVPTYSVVEAAALLSISHEHLYRLIRADAFPAVRLRTGREHGRYVVPAQAVEALLKAASTGGGRVEAAEYVIGGDR